MMSKIRKFKGFVQANENKKLDVKRESLNETKFSLDQEMMGQASDTQNLGGVLQDKEQLDDDTFSESKNRRIKNFKQYVAESFIVVPKNYHELLQTCINAIKTQCGSLKWEDLLKVASANPTDIAKDTLVHSYMYKLIVDTIIEQGEYNVTLQDEDEGMAENEVVVQGTKAIADAITDEVFGRIKEGKDEKIK